MFENFQNLNGEIVNNQWIEWEHGGVPNSPKVYREIIRLVLALLGHCMNCTALDGCYFVERNMPEIPLHDRCDCRKINTTASNVKHYAKADCPIEKFTKYIFSDYVKSKGKKEIFESLGYTKEDSYRLKLEIEKQSLSNYLLGNYVLKNLDANGQRLAIPTKLAGKTFYTGWMLEPEGKIRNTTPFGGWVNEI